MSGGKKFKEYNCLSSSLRIYQLLAPPPEIVSLGLESEEALTYMYMAQNTVYLKSSTD